MLNAINTLLVVVDVQGKLAHLMHNRESLFKSLKSAICGAQILDLPILLTEQYPEGMGGTTPEISALLKDVMPISKTSFSCCGSEAFMAALKQIGRYQVLLAGIEAHVCVQQTALDLLDDGYEVQVLGDAVSSRDPENRTLAFDRMRDAGAIVTSTEAALFELMRKSEGPAFKQILSLVK
ncbi:MAG: hydrolase [Desulfobacterales bacterium]|nr:hydrolase [Desulfobacterales bacterium]